MPTVMMPNRILNKIRYATVSALWLSLNEQLNRLNHLRRQLHGSISLIQYESQLHQFLYTPFVKKAQINLMKTKYGESIGRVNLLDSDSEFDIK